MCRSQKNFHCQKALNSEENFSFIFSKISGSSIFKVIFLLNLLECAANQPFENDSDP